MAEACQIVPDPTDGTYSALRTPQLDTRGHFAAGGDGKGRKERKERKGEKREGKGREGLGKDKG